LIALKKKCKYSIWEMGMDSLRGKCQYSKWVDAGWLSIHPRIIPIKIQIHGDGTYG
jgi:hypothetical protein